MNIKVDSPPPDRKHSSRTKYAELYDTLNSTPSGVWVEVTCDGQDQMRSLYSAIQQHAHRNGFKLTTQWRTPKMWIQKKE